MTVLVILSLTALVLATVLATWRTIHDDGLGRRLPPRSHQPEPFDPHRGLRTC